MRYYYSSKGRAQSRRDEERRRGSGRFATPAYRAYKSRQRLDRCLSAGLVWVYELWAPDHRCLYVGKTNSLTRRRDGYAAHPKGAAARAYREHSYMVLSMAEDVEARRIQELRPAYNVRLNRANGVTHDSEGRLF